MEVEKSNNLPFARQRPKKVNGVTQAESENLGTRTSMLKSRRRGMSQLKQSINSPFLCLFVLAGPSTEWTTLMRANFITQSHSNTNLFQTQTQTETIFYQIKLTHKTNHHNNHTTFILQDISPHLLIARFILFPMNDRKPVKSNKDDTKSFILGVSE